MTDQDLINRIKELKKIQPSESWRVSARHNLINRARLAEPEKNEYQLGWLHLFKNLQTAALLICLIAAPWLTIKAAQSSLPGDLLYSVKRAGEGIQTRIASDETQVQLQVEFANRRMEELNKLTETFSERKNIDKEKKTETAKQVITDLKSNLAGANIYFIESKITKEKAVAVAKKAKKIEEDLIKTKEDIPLEVQADIAEAEKTIDDIKHKILTVLMEREKENNATATSTTLITPDEEVLIFLKETDSGIVTTTEKETLPECSK